MDGGGASAGSGANLALSLNAAPVDVGQLLASRASARLVTETELANKGRAIKNGSGAGSRQIHFACKTCPTWFDKACKQKTKDFKITAVGKTHTNCAGGERTASKVVRPLVNKLVRANPKIGGPAIKKTLKTAGYDIAIRQAQRKSEYQIRLRKTEGPRQKLPTSPRFLLHPVFYFPHENPIFLCTAVLPPPV